MSQEEKQILLADLCGRLPYEVKVNISASMEYDNYIPSINDATIIALDLRNGRCKFKEFYWDKEIVNVRPYLRSLSNMTEEEINEFHKLRFRHINYGSEPLQGVLSIDEIEWLNQHHFDYRNLIRKGLAIEAPEGMYNTKTE